MPLCEAFELGAQRRDGVVVFVLVTIVVVVEVDSHGGKESTTADGGVSDEGGG
jgi:hypothetical protein